jgi:hypothetical protein
MQAASVPVSKGLVAGEIGELSDGEQEAVMAEFSVQGDAADFLGD